MRAQSGSGLLDFGPIKPSGAARQGSGPFFALPNGAAAWAEAKCADASEGKCRLGDDSGSHQTMQRVPLGLCNFSQLSVSRMPDLRVGYATTHSLFFFSFSFLIGLRQCVSTLIGIWVMHRGRRDT